MARGWPYKPAPSTFKGVAPASKGVAAIYRGVAPASKKAALPAPHSAPAIATATAGSRTAAAAGKSGTSGQQQQQQHQAATSAGTNRAHRQLLNGKTAIPATALAPANDNDIGGGKEAGSVTGCGVGVCVDGKVGVVVDSVMSVSSSDDVAGILVGGDAVGADIVSVDGDVFSRGGGCGSHGIGGDSVGADGVMSGVAGDTVCCGYGGNSCDGGGGGGSCCDGGTGIDVPAGPSAPAAAALVLNSMV